MNIAILGTGNMGAGLATLLATSNYEVAIGARDPAKAAVLAEKIGHRAIGGGIAAAVKLADVVILAVPFGAIGGVLKEAEDLSGKVLIDITNPITADFKGLEIGHTTSAAEDIQKLAPKAIVVKAFNTIFAQLLPRNARTGKTLQVFVASDDDTAKTQVSTLAQALGFEPINVGQLSNSRFIEPIGEMNIHFGYFLGHGPTVAPAWIKA